MVRVFDFAGFFVSVIGVCVATSNYTCGASGQEACEDAQVEQQKISMLQYRSITENVEPSKRRVALLAEIAAIDAELNGLRDKSSRDGQRPPYYSYTKLQDAFCSEDEYPTRLGSWKSGSVQEAEQECNEMKNCKGVHYSAKNQNYVLVSEVGTTTENTNPPNECYAKTGIPAPRMSYPKLQDAACSEDEYPSRLTGWTKGDMQKAEMECNQMVTCKGIHYNVPNANYVLVSKVGTTSENTNGGNECYLKPVGPAPAPSPTPSYGYAKIQNAFCSEDEYPTRLGSWKSGSVQAAEEECNEMKTCKGVHYSAKNQNYVLVSEVGTTTENTNPPNECYAKAGMPAPWSSYPMLQDAYCSEDEYPSRLTGWTKGDMQKAEMMCNQIVTCKGVHYNVPNANYVLVSKVGTTSVNTNGGNECYVKTV